MKLLLIIIITTPFLMQVTVMMMEGKLTYSVHGTHLTTPSMATEIIIVIILIIITIPLHSKGHGDDDGGGEADLFCPWDASNNAFNREDIMIMIIMIIIIITTPLLVQVTVMMMEVARQIYSVHGMHLTTPSMETIIWLQYNNNTNHSLTSTGHGDDDGGGEADLFCPWDASNNAFNREDIIIIIITTTPFLIQVTVMMMEEEKLTCSVPGILLTMPSLNNNDSLVVKWFPWS